MSEERKRAARAKEAKIEADREARFREKPAEIRDAILTAGWKDRAARTKLRPGSVLSGLRVGEICRVLADRYGCVEFKLPEDDAGLDDAKVLANCLGLLPKIQLGTIVRKLEAHAPWLPFGSALKMAERAMKSPTKFKADTLAAKLGVTVATRTRLNLRTIGAIDMTSEERKARRRAMKAAREAERRRVAGAMPRAEYEAQSLSRSRPWESDGITRRTWERRQKRLKAAVSQVRGQYIAGGDTEHGTHLRHKFEDENTPKTFPTGEGRGAEPAPFGSSLISLPKTCNWGHPAWDGQAIKVLVE